MKTFANRQDAGRRLGGRLALQFDGQDVVVLALPRGGVPVGYEVARILNAPLDVIVVRKLGVPLRPELAMGAIGEDGVFVVEHDTMKIYGVTDAEFERVVVDEREELNRRVRTYRRGRPPIRLEEKLALIVDDGLATGATADAACVVARDRGAKRVIMSAPVSSHSAAKRMDDVADQFLCLEAIGGPFAVGQWYEDFLPTTDQEVIDDLNEAIRSRQVDRSSSSTRPDEPTSCV